ncbi:metallophosphoesterase [Gemelliphila palaticanis]|uniref:Metallophosphoesterase n=1 Tax=Gemelliphila palaticanis TaxID=81950 RepID=A0ABX2SYQ5_9BACL|nr:metallophosphoesterase [Gemella palaticanis]MBF0715493.1 metallophosphoesterase [Gemella palaticanis]NYS47423.1 metallophosphoesterase [Gemella palaticanis]
MNKLRKNIYKLFPIAILGLYLHQNKFVSKREFNIIDKKIPSNFNGYKIIQLSDIHSDKIGISDILFLEKIKTEKPDIIIITGDLFDSYNNEPEIAYNLLSQFSSIAPCYFISGNHELRLQKDYNDLKIFMKRLGIINLNNIRQEINIKDHSISISGIEDFNYFKNEDKYNYYANYRNKLKSNIVENSYNILLAHRPEKFDMYSDLGYNLIFSGHAHGGQWNIPFLGRIYAPSQGFFPKYTNGIYENNNSKMIVSQGLGNSSFPTRLNNRLEYIVVNLFNKF